MTFVGKSTPLRRAIIGYHADPALPGGGGKRPACEPIKLIERARDNQPITQAEIEAFQEGLWNKEILNAQEGALAMALRINGYHLSLEDGTEFTSTAARKTSQGVPLTRQEIFDFITACVRQTVTEYEIGGWLMAVRLKGLTDEEVAYLSEAMWKTGGEIDLSSLAEPTADKHAAGGSSDNTSFIVAPLLACVGISVPMMSGRMLAHTGGTLDKLEAIPGFRVNLTEDDVIDQLHESGLAIFGQMPTIAPADGLLYGLRQLTGTVQSVPLIAASIISKKLAEGAGNLVLLGTFGSGAFARDPEEAAALSTLMMKAAQMAGRNVKCLLVDMSQPLTPFVGPALEMRTAIEVLRGSNDPRLNRLRDLSIEIAAHLAVMAGKFEDLETASIVFGSLLHDGGALAAFKEMVDNQGGDVDYVTNPKLFELAPIRLIINAQEDGYVQAIRADEIGNAVNDLGAGRTGQRPKIDHGVGVSRLALVGDRVERGQVIAAIHARSESEARTAAERILRAYTIGPEYVAPPELIARIIS